MARSGAFAHSLSVSRSLGVCWLLLLRWCHRDVVSGGDGGGCGAAARHRDVAAVGLVVAAATATAVVVVVF